MAKNRSSSRNAAAVTFQRAPRLYRLLKLLGKKPQTRDKLTRQLGLDIRSFYRDLNLLREAGISVLLQEGRYVLQGDIATHTPRLPFPDPLLTLGEAQQLARGRTNAHRKLRRQIDQIIK
jgi:predicted DNA-binding transcriptional regulator YafY